MKYVVAVSGGVDSVVLLDMLAKAGQVAVVAHVDHGIRPDSAADARFVEALAHRYRLPFVVSHEQLGPNASEDTARRRRYDFLRTIAAEYGVPIAAAHHADDVVETVAINAIRGTGWRGLAVMGAADIVRPLLWQTKQQLYQYALCHRLEWVEDSTNASDRYLRNIVRHKLARLPAESKVTIRALWQHQLQLAASIDTEVARLLADYSELPRHLFIMVTPEVARELLRRVAITQTGTGLTRPQLDRGVLAVKTTMPGATVQLSAEVHLQFTKRTVVVVPGQKVI